MTTEWSHLPNAAHIDAVLASVKANPDDWDAAYNAARNAARDAARDAARYAAWYAARNAARNAAWDAARDAILALIAYDDCAHMLDSEPDDLRILSKLGSHAATLMIPASIAFKSIREKQVVVL
jgi:hypothetical protein